ncbi:hypothetical protein, partial [Pedobacter sp. ASV12]|uniref:hypothetical protein n=1 Tax=Pedobacter sp. ASV12 TaxID=2795120 RepID=UPI0018EB28F0
MSSENHLNGATDFATSIKGFVKNWPYFLISIAVCLILVYGFLYITPPVSYTHLTLPTNHD